MRSRWQALGLRRLCLCGRVANVRRIRRASVLCYESAHFGLRGMRDVLSVQAVRVGRQCGQKKCRKLLPSGACAVVLFVLKMGNPLLDLVVGATRLVGRSLSLHCREIRRNLMNFDNACFHKNAAPLVTTRPGGDYFQFPCACRGW